MLVQLILSSAFLACTNDPITPRAYVMENLSQGIGGPKALAQKDDIILENEYLRAAIIGKRVSMGPHTDGGGLVDADIQRRHPKYANGYGNDQLAEIFSTINMNVPHIDENNGSVEILSDGSDGTAIVCTVGDSKPFISLLDALWPLLGWKDANGVIFDIRTDYILESGSPVIKMRTTALFGENAGCQEDITNATVITDAPRPDDPDAPSLIQIALDEGVAFGDFYLQGGSLNVFTPGIGFDESGHVYELKENGINTFSNPILADFIAGTGHNVSYGIANPNGPMYIPLFTSSQTVGFSAAFIAEDSALDGYSCYGRRCFPDQIQYERWFTVGEGDVGSIVDHFLMASGETTGSVSGFVREEDTGIAITNASVFVYQCDDSGTCSDAPYSQWLTDVGDDPVEDGSFGGLLPVGNYELLVHKKGRPDSPRIPFTVTANTESTMVLGSPMPSTVSFELWDDFDRSIPAKVSFFSVDDVDVLNEDLGDGYISGNPSAVVFAPYGEGTVTLPPGEYYAVASRGPEYEIDISEPFTLSATSHVDLDMHLFKTVETEGWISADFHVHSSPSHDSGVGYNLRVSTMVAEGVEYFTGTDHDFISDFDPTIEEMGLTEWVNSAPGIETTTIEVGHYLGFPVKVDHLSNAGGAVDWTGLRPQEMIDDIRELIGPEKIEPVVYIGHPRDGILGYFDQYRLDPYGDNQGDINVLGSSFAIFNQLLDQSSFSTDVDALEILNGKRFDFVRTPTQSELNQFADGEELSNYDMNTRTMEEQEALSDTDGEFLLGYGHEGQVDDWFTLLNLGYRFTALGNSDTHGTTKTESGCPRNYVYVGNDDPLFVDDAEIATAVREHRVVASYGPFVEFYANGDRTQGIGSDVETNNGEVTFHIEVQSPTWFNVDRVELYENGTLIEEYSIPVPNTSIVNFSEDITLTPSKDSWYVVIAVGDDNLAPLYTSVEIPPIQLQDVILEAFGDVELSVNVASFLDPLVPIPRSYDIIPFALTNPIWVDQNGDGAFTAPGLPDWLRVPVDPNSAE